MNCLEFRRAATLDPRRLDAAAAAHAEACPSCRDFRSAALRFERRLERGLHVPVPRRFADRLLAALTWRRRAAWYAVAAALLLTVGAAAIAAFWGDDPLARAGIDFVVHDEARTIVEAKPVGPAMLASVEREMRISFAPQLGEVRYICRYPFAAGAAHHLLVTTSLGKVTLLLFPGKALASRGAASANGLQAAVVPVPGGTATIVADSARGVARIEALLRSI